MSSLYITPKMERTIKAIKDAPWENKAFYQGWLAQTYYYTRYSTRILAMAAGWSATDDKTYYHRALSHIREEQGHEMIALNDMKKIASPTIDKFEEYAVTRAMWASEYEKALRNPSYILGYILALETLACKTFKPLLERLESIYPSDACMMVKVHADDDPDHVEKALEQIDLCTPEVRKEILKFYDHTCDMYRLMIQTIREETGT